MALILQVKKVREGAYLPDRAYPGDAGFDFYAPQDAWISGAGNLLPLGVAVAVPEGWALVLKDRSGNAAKKGLRVAAGVIDSGYRGEVSVLLDVVSDPEGKGVYVTQGDRVCQGLLVPVPTAGVWEVDELPDAQRGGRGFGSTGE